MPDARLVLVALALGLGLSACPRGPSPLPPPRGAPVFDHQAHLAEKLAPVEGAAPGAPAGGLSCGSCHGAAADVDESAVERPGAADHAPCDTCHAAAFYEAPGPMCLVCHLEVNAKEKGRSPLHPFPRGD